MKRKALFLILYFFACLPCRGLFAQDALSDSALNARSLSAVRAQYMKSVGINSYLYNGIAYERYWNRTVGHPFFMTEEFQQGSVNYDGTLYENVPLSYDMLRDVLVTKTFSKENNIQLLGEKVYSFTIGTHAFVRVVADSSNNSLIATGFYEKLHGGNIVVLFRRVNKIELSAKAEDNTSKFTEYDHYYIVKDGKYHAVEGEGDLQSVFKDQKAEIRKFLNRRDINYKKDPPKTIVQTVSFYEQLKK